MKTSLVLLGVLALCSPGCSRGASESSGATSERRPRRGHSAEDVPGGEGSPHALPEGDPVAMPRDGVHGGGGARGGMPSDAVHGGGGMPGDAVHGGGMPADPTHGGGGEMPGAAAAGGPDLQWDAPDEWRSVQPSSSMRVAEWVLAKQGSDPADATLVVFHFPGGGGVQANLDRWYTQFEQPDGRPSSEVAQTSTRTVADLRVTITDVSGTFNGGGMMGGPPAGPQPDYRMVAAIVETPGGPWFFKLIGPKRTVEHWRASFDAFIVSLHLAS